MGRSRVMMQEPERGRMAAITPYILLWAFYLLLALIFTYPLISHIADHTPTADGSADQLQTIWFFWWMKTALFSLHQNPYWTDFVYFPHGTGLAYHLSPFTNLQAVAVSALTDRAINSATVYNLLLLGSFAATGLAAFVLIRRLTNHALAAFWGSIVVAVSPYRLWHLNHLNLLSLGWGIFAIHFVLKLIERPSRRDAILAALAFGALFHTSLSDAWMIAFFLAVYLLFDVRRLWNHTERRKILSHLGLAALVASVIALPGLIGMANTDAEWKISWRDTEMFSADLPSFVIPANESSFAAQLFGIDGGFAAGYGGEMFLGWMLIAACAAVIVFQRRKISFRWLYLAGIFFVLSLGPTLKFGTHRFLEGWLPYRWLFETVPFLSLSRTPGRFVVLVHVCLVIFAAQGVAAWHANRKVRDTGRRITGAERATLGTILIVGVLLFENTDGNVQLWDMMVPAVYYQLAADPTIHAVFDGPIVEAKPICNGYMYWQTIHGKKVANGYLTHRSRGADALLEQARRWTEYSDSQKAALLDAGIDALVFHRSTDDVRLARLRRDASPP